MGVFSALSGRALFAPTRENADSRLNTSAAARPGIAV